MMSKSLQLSYLPWATAMDFHLSTDHRSLDICQETLIQWQQVQMRASPNSGSLHTILPLTWTPKSEIGTQPCKPQTERAPGILSSSITIIPNWSPNSINFISEISLKATSSLSLYCHVPHFSWQLLAVPPLPVGWSLIHPLQFMLLEPHPGLLWQLRHSSPRCCRFGLLKAHTYILFWNIVHSWWSHLT